MKIIAFPFAGGNKFSYEFLNKIIPPHINMTVLEYPGRGMRIREPLLDNLETILEDGMKRFSEIVDNKEKYIIWGHSMGALIGYLLCQRIQQEGRYPLPTKLIVSGKSAPSIGKKQPISHLASSSFWEEISQLGGVPKEILEDQQLTDFYEPILKSDLRIIEQYNYIKNEPLSVSIDVFYGSEEKLKESDIFEWKNESSKEVHIYEFPGDHFFIYNHGDFFRNHFVNVLDC
jgi:surfactin synthase thioesterase subunit